MLPACLLALIAGYADTVGFLRYEAFAGLMTGNTILLGIEVARGQWRDAGFHAAIMAAFLAGVILSRVILRLGIEAWVALCIAAVLLVICGLLDKTLAALVLPLAMGMQNSAANRFNGVALNTVFITGNIQKVGEGLLAWIWPSNDPKAPKSDGFAIFGLVWLAYAVGRRARRRGKQFDVAPAARAGGAAAIHHVPLGDASGRGVNRGPGPHTLGPGRLRLLTHSVEEMGRLLEDALAEVIDDLLAFAQRHLGGVLDRRRAVGTHEAVLAALAVDHLRDRTCDLELAALRIGLRLDQEAVVLDAAGGGGRFDRGGLAEAE